MKKLSISKGLLNRHTGVLHCVSTKIKVIDRGKLVVGVRLALLWASAGVGLIGLFFGFDLIGEAFKDCLTVLFELIQEKLETMYRTGFKLDLYHAQMATAYTGFVAFLGFGFILVKKFSAILRDLRSSWNQERIKAQELLLKHRENIMDWWETLDYFNKLSAVVGLTVMAVPVFAMLCLALGKVVAALV